ncbi:MAG TPA: transglutaminase-like domain-containing protein [Luteolibacter sp.]|nr:transglutaminase-like domain-containing protein [Luteolibacter sp.]
MSASTHAAPPSSAELAALIRLLDDETPEVRRRVAERIALCGGDLSEWLASSSISLDDAGRRTLAELLRPARRAALRRDWLAPSGGADAMRDDWDQLEAMLRVISDFLHDGVTIRQPLSDALDLLAEEAEAEGVSNARELRKFLFADGRLSANQEDYDSPNNSDLAWCVEEGRSNPLGLAVIFILVAKRLDFVVEGVNFPGHFLTRIYEDGYPIIVDCFDGGQLHLQSTLLESPELSREERDHLRRAATTGTILLRLLNNLVAALDAAKRPDDARLVRDLRGLLK